jgi:DNA-binding CsgD family transcriptional regulator
MNQVVEEMKAILEGNNELAHYGMPRRSGRYPWGSGENAYQRTGDFLSRVEKLKAEGWEETADNIKKEFGLTTGEYRKEKSICKDQRRLMDVARVKSLKADGLSNSEVGRIMGINESTVRSLLDKESEARMMETGKTVKFLRDQVNEKGMIDVGVGVGREINVSDDRLETALYYLKEKEGYEVYSGRFEQPTNPGQWTTQRVLCKPGTEYKEIYNLDQVKTINDYITRDGGDTFEKKFHYPESLDSKRLMIRYKEDGGIDKDGIVELRRGVEDLSLGESRYAQVRILVDGTHYIKGMAVYSDDMPKGVDVIFNTNKTKDKPMKDVLKEIKEDPDNPFGSLIKDADQGGQYWYDDKKTGERKLGLINKRADEGDWNEWADALPSQFLGKQSKAMAKKQLDLAKADKKAEYDEICSLTNPTIKKHLLQKFSDECDAAAVNLKAAALPGQKYHVIIPVNTLKDTEVYAPNYENGTKLALIRYPHGGTFEIPILTVNNKHQAARKLLGTDISDAVGINAKVAERLSGADFDGDTVMCIPTHDKSGKVKITNKNELAGLKGFDPKLEYGPETYKGREVQLMSKGYTQKQMGVISNLITDMTLAGASDDKLARAVRHSMVVIDAHKHKLDYKKSEVDNNIAALKKEFQPKYDADGNVIGYGGAATILSRAKGEASVNKRQGSSSVNVEINPLTGKKNPKYDPSRPEGAKIYKDADDLYYPDRKYDKSTGEYILRTTDGKKVSYKAGDKDAAARYEPVKVVDPKTGSVSYTSKDGSVSYKVNTRTQKSTKMAETDDAYTLVSTARHPMEMLYADHANYMKSLGNQARKEMVSTGKIEYKSSAKAAYQKEVDSLNAKLNDAEKNVTRERAAQRSAAAVVKAKKQASDNVDKNDLKKAGQQAVSKYRTEYGSVSRRDRNIKITDSEWEAIQAGAISESKLKRILNNTDISELKERATPRTNKSNLTSSKVNQIKRMSASNYTLDEIARKLGISPSTVSKYLKGAN